MLNKKAYLIKLKPYTHLRAGTTINEITTTPHKQVNIISIYYKQRPMSYTIPLGAAGFGAERCTCCLGTPQYLGWALKSGDVAYSRILY